MEEYSQYSSSWMWNMHQREEDYVYGGAGGNDGSSGPSNVGGCEDFGNSLDQLNKIVERIAPDGRGPLPKKDMNSRRMSLDESHFNDNVYETFLGYGNNGANEMLGDYPAHVSGYEGSGWNPTTCEPYLGIAFSGMSDRRVEKFDGMEPGNRLENKHELIACKRETFSEKESGVSKLTLVSNSEQRPGQSFEKLRSSKNFDEFEGNRAYTKTKHRAAEGRESPSTKHFESLSLERNDGKQRMQSPEWSNSKQLLEIGKYTEAGVKNTDTTSPHNSVGHLTTYGESSMNYDSLSSLSMGGNVAYEHTMSDCADAKTDDDAKLYACSQCSYRAVKKGQLRKHMSVHGMFLCAHCEFASEHADGLETHRRTHHPGLCGRKLCKKCRVLYQGDELKEHESVCSGEKQRWPCMTCNKEFKFLSVMKAHVRKWHPSVAANDPSLGDGFPPVADSTTEEVAGGSDVESEQGITKSVLEAESELGFRCDDCDKVFKSRWMLSNHRVLHCTDVPFFCDTNGCSTTFRSDKELNVHRMKVHELGPKKYPCCHPDCSMQFAKYGHYKRHKLTHIVGERKFKCDWPNCGKAFSHTDNLKVHYRRHTDEKPYKCQHCESAYRQKSGLKYHLEKVHDERSTGRPGRKRKSIGPPEGEPERPGMMRADNFTAADCEGCGYDYPAVSRALSSSDGGSRKTVGGNPVAVKLFVKKPRLASRDGDFVEISKTPAPRKQDVKTDVKMESEGEGDRILTSGDITSVSSAKPNPGAKTNPGASARLGEIGLNDEWVIDEPFNDVDVKKEKEEKLEKPQVVDSSSDFRCTSPKIEPLDVDLGEELRRLSDVISGEIRTTSVDPANVHSLSEYMSNDHMTIQQGGGDAYLHRFAVPLHGSYRHHADLYRGDRPSQADDLDLYAAGKYRASLNNQPYDQFCRSSSSADRVPEMGSYSASGYTCQPHPSPLKLRLATSSDPLGASGGHQVAYNDPGARVWMPPDGGGLDDASPASGRSTRSDLSLANSGDIADHYREAHTALLPTSSPIIQHQTSASDELGGAPAYVERPVSRTLPSSWSRSFEEDEEEEEEEDDREEEEEEEEDDAGGEERWPDQCSDWCQPPFTDRPVADKGNVDLPSAQAKGPSTSAAIPMSSYSTNQAPSIWPADKSHESAFSHRMQGIGAGYGVSPSTRPSGWDMEDGGTFGYRPGGDPFVGNSGSTAAKRTSAYGVLRGADKFSPGMALRDESYEAAREPNYYSALHRPPPPPADPLMYRYYGPSGSHPHHQYGQAAFDLQGSGRSWVGLAPDNPGFPPLASNARGSGQSPVYPSPLMLYPSMPPYF